MLVIYFDSNLLSFIGGQFNLRFSFIQYKIIFTIFCFIFIFTNIYLLKKIKDESTTIAFQTNNDKKTRKGIASQRLYKMVTIGQLLVISLMLFLLTDILVFTKYHVLEILIILSLSYITGLYFLLLTAFKFIKWYKQKINHLFLLYFILFVLYSLNLTISFLLINLETLDHPKEKREIPIHLFYSNLFGERTALEKDLNIIYNIFGSVIFILIWIVTMLLLKSNSIRLGKIQYWILISLPLLSFFSIFQYKGDVIQNFFHLPNNFQYQANYIFITSLIEHIYAIMFGIYFFMVYRKVVNQIIKKYLIFMIVGIVFLFSSHEIYAIKLLFFPPFGIITLSYIGISSFLVYYGLLGLAMSLSRNRDLSQEIYKLIKKDPLMLDITFSQEIENIIREKINTLPNNLTYEVDKEDEITKKELDNIMEFMKTELKKVKESK